MASATQRSLLILELLSGKPKGLSIRELAELSDLAPSVVHRQLGELVRLGYVAQQEDRSDYVPTIKLAALGLMMMGRSGLSDLAQPALNALAQAVSELTRLSVVDGRSLYFVAAAQGVKQGLRYDPGDEHGAKVHLASTASGRAWLAEMSDDAALMLVAEQGLTPELPMGSNGISSPRALLDELEATRERGYGLASESYLAGMTSVAIPIRDEPTGEVIGCVAISAPSVRMGAARQLEVLVELRRTAELLGQDRRTSSFFRAADRGPGTQFGT